MSRGDETLSGGSLVDSAVAVNEAPTGDPALVALTEAAQALLDADGSIAILWEGGGDAGVVRAASGAATGLEGQTLTREWELPTEARIASRVVVPLELGPDSVVTLQVAWFAEQSAERLERARVVLETLGRLTQIGASAETERKPSRDEARLQAVLECVGDAVWIETKDGTRLNPAARALLGLADGDTVRDLDTELRDLDGLPIPDDERPRARALATGAPVPFLHKRTRKDGVERVFQGSAAPVYAAEGEAVGTVVTFRDVTDDYNRTLLTERFLELLFEALPLAVSVADPVSGEILSVNRAFTELVGYDPTEMVGSLPPHPWWADVPDLDVPGLGAQPAPVEALFRRRDGRLIPIEVVSLAVTETAGAAAASVSLVTDLSERRRFEQQLVQSGKLAAIGELAAGVAHEINNPLFAILGLVEFLLKEVEPGTKAHNRLELIQQTGLEIKDVVRALLDFARERADELEVVDVATVVAQTVELLRRTNLHKEIELVERYPEAPLHVFASPGQVKQVVLNLVTNAQQAMAETGSITLEVFSENETAVVRVTDTGPGIAPDVIDRIFDPFFTTKREIGGTGLGLALSQSIVDAHGGTLAAASPTGGGAVFTLRLPRTDEPA
jgi:PAS domain S-box-containing protein